MILHPCIETALPMIHTFPLSQSLCLLRKRPQIYSLARSIAPLGDKSFSPPLRPHFSSLKALLLTTTERSVFPVIAFFVSLSLSLPRYPVSHPGRIFLVCSPSHNTSEAFESEEEGYMSTRRFFSVVSRHTPMSIKNFFLGFFSFQISADLLTVSMWVTTYTADWREMRKFYLVLVSQTFSDCAISGGGDVSDKMTKRFHWAEAPEIYLIEPPIAGVTFCDFRVVSSQK